MSDGASATGAGSAGEARVWDSRWIQTILPHRYPILLVDRVLEIEPGKRIVALKNVTVNEEFFLGHFPDVRSPDGGRLFSKRLSETRGYYIQPWLPDVPDFEHEV